MILRSVRVNRFWLIIGLSTVTVFILIFFVVQFLSNRNLYYVIIDNNFSVIENTPLMIDNVEFGRVINREDYKDDPNKILLTLKIDNSINIPDKSYFAVMADTNDQTLLKI